MGRLSILLLNDDANPEVRLKVNKLVADQFPDKEKPPFLLPSRYGDENDDKTRSKLKDALVKIKQFKETENLSKDRLNSIPKKATIRAEFIKCGRDTCNNCPHGPYYYACWKDKLNNNNNSKLRKKYMGITDIRQ